MFCAQVLFAQNTFLEVTVDNVNIAYTNVDESNLNIPVAFDKNFHLTVNLENINVVWIIRLYTQ